MTLSNNDSRFAGSVPDIYERYLVPLIFEPYAEDLVKRAVSMGPIRVLEIAAGTGVVTRALSSALPPEASIVATDLNQAMLDQAMKTGIKRHVEWRQADAMQLPFEDHPFDMVICQFGAMFFPNKARAFAEVYRVLQPGGVFLFNVWDAISENEFADEVTNALAAIYPQDPPQFLARTPYAYHDVVTIRHDLALGGFAESCNVTTVTARSRATSASVPAIGFCQGTPLRSEIESRHAMTLNEATDVAAAAVARRFGTGVVEGKIQAHVISAMR